MSPDERITFEKELAVSVELQKQFSFIEETLHQTSVFKEAAISTNYFQNLIPLFRTKSSGKQERVFNPSYAGSLLMLLIIFITMIFQNDFITNSGGNNEIKSGEFNQEEILSILDNMDYRNGEYDLNQSDEMNLDSLIVSYITDAILLPSGTESSAIRYFKLDPDEIQLSDTETENLFALILNKKFF